MASDGNEDVIAALRMRFDERLPGNKTRKEKTKPLPPLTRKLALGLVDDLIQTLAPHLREETEEWFEDEGPVTFDHDAIALLIQLRDAIDDLNRGKTHAALRAQGHEASARRSTEVRKRQEAVVELADVELAERRRTDPSATQRAADEDIAEALRNKGNRDIYGSITGTKIKSLRDTQARRKKNKRPNGAQE